MNLTKLFADSTHLRSIRESINAETELQEVLLSTQMHINGFLRDVGNILHSDFVADTFMLFGEAYSTEVYKFFSVAAALHDKATNHQEMLIFPFVFVLAESMVYPGQTLSPGLYFVEDHAQG